MSENFGSYLKSEREAKGIRLEEIASITKIHIHSLELMERGQWENLPPEPFIRGFITAYAKYVGMDPKSTIQRFVEEQVTKENLASPLSQSPEVKEVEAPPAEAVMSEMTTLPIKKILMTAGTLAVLAVTFALIRIGKNSSQPQTTHVAETSRSVGQELSTLPLTAPAPATETSGEKNIVATDAAKTLPATSVTNEEALTKETERKPSSQAAKVEPEKTEPAKAEAKSEPIKPVVAATAPNTEKPSEKHTEKHEEKKAEAKVAPPSTPASSVAAEISSATGQAGVHQISIQGKERTWMKVVTDDKKPVETFLEKGATATYSANEKIKIVLGNSAGTKVLYNGTEVPGVKFSGTIRSYIFPPEARFPQDPVGKRKTASSDKKEEAKTTEDPAPPVSSNEPNFTGRQR